MPTSNDPRGRLAELYVGTQPTMLAPVVASPTDLFVRRHFYDLTPTPQSEPQDDAILGGGFHNSIDDRPAVPDIERGSVRIVWPLDLIQIGFALAEVLGQPTTTGAGPYVHTFSSATAVLPIRTMERKLNDVAFDGIVGVVGRSIQFPIGSDRGYTRVNCDYFARQVLKQYSPSIAGVAAPLAITARVPRAVGTIKKDGVAIGSIISGDATISNSLGEDSYHGSPLIDDVQLEGRSTALNLTGRFKSNVLRDFGEIAVGDYLPGAMDIELAWSLSATLSLVLTFRNQRFAKTGIPTSGPGRMDVALKSRGEVGAASPMVTAVLTNSQVGY